MSWVYNKEHLVHIKAVNLCIQKIYNTRDQFLPKFATVILSFVPNFSGYDQTLLVDIFVRFSFISIDESAIDVGSSIVEC